MIGFQIVGPPALREKFAQREERSRIETRSTEPRSAHLHPCPGCQYPTTLHRCNGCTRWEAIEARAAVEHSGSVGRILGIR